MTRLLYSNKVTVVIRYPAFYITFILLIISKEIQLCVILAQKEEEAKLLFWLPVSQDIVYYLQL